MNPEKRNSFVSADALDCMEVRFAPVSDSGEIEGVAVRFDVVDSYRTTFDRSAFAWNGQRLPLLWSHDRREVVGSVRAVAVEGDGLKIRGKLNLEVQRAREVRAMLLEGDIGGLSIGFSRLADEPRMGGIRHITKAELVEVSFVALPSVPGSRVTSVRVHQEPSHASAVAFVASVRKAALALKGNLK